MNQKVVKIGITIAILSLMLAACGSAANLTNSQATPTVKDLPSATLPEATQVPQASNGGGAADGLAAYQNALESVYQQVNPSVVNIQVVQKQQSSTGPSSGLLPFFNIPGFPNFFGSPDQQSPQQNAPQYSQALGSGFVWDNQGNIITNNHVIDGADKIEVKFADGSIVPAKLVGADPDSDLAVVQVDVSATQLTPIKVTDSSQVKVGQIAIAIGNPFGLENTMTVGIVSALGRTLPTNENNVNGPSYSIPDIIQTDAPINPGNSGGPLVNDQGALIGVTSAIESPAQVNSGVGFAIPSAIVQNVVPELIRNGKYEHSYLGISGISLDPDLSKEMKLDSAQRGVLVEDVVSDGPADKAGLHGSDRQVSINGQDVRVGGDVITAIDGQPVKTMDDLIAYLADHTTVGQKVTLTVLRNGSEQSFEATLQARPAATSTPTQTAQTQNRVWLGIAVQPVTPEIAHKMNLPDNQSGVLIEQIEAGSPADQAGLRGSFKPVLINGQRILVGGDIITAIDGKSVTSLGDLRAALQDAQPGQKVTLTILRDGQTQDMSVTLAEHQ